MVVLCSLGSKNPEGTSAEPIAKCMMHLPSSACPPRLRRHTPRHLVWWLWSPLVFGPFLAPLLARGSR
jgi:hypothetical protein